MKKFLSNLKNRRGFTLIELMMVVAVIGILAAVLIPKIGGTKDSARLAGVESNMRQVEAQVHAMERYKNDAETFQDVLESATGDLENPFTGSEDDAVVFDGSASKGVISVDITTDGDAVTEVEITPYDQDENDLDSKTISFVATESE